MLVYPFIHGADSVWLILGLRVVQGIALAVYSSCVVAVLVDCIPKGQSARGFAIFSLGALLPYATIPALGEQLLALLGGAVIDAGFGYRGVFAAAAVMALCSGGFMILDRLRLARWERRAKWDHSRP